MFGDIKLRQERILFTHHIPYLFYLFLSTSFLSMIVIDIMLHYLNTQEEIPVSYGILNP